jgi:hypothetical protein
VLEESLTGNQCHTTVMGCISPCIKDTQQTLNTLRYAASLQGKKRPTLAGVATSVLAMNKLSKGAGGGGGGGGGGSGAATTMTMTPTKRPPPVSPRGSKTHTSNPLHSTGMSGGGGGHRVPSPRSASQVKETGSLRKVKSMSQVKDDSDILHHRTTMPRRATNLVANKGHLPSQNSSDDDEEDVVVVSGSSSHHDHVMKGHNMRRRLSLTTRDDLSLLLDPLGLEQFREQLKSAAQGASAQHVKDLGVVKFVNLGIPKIRALKLQKRAEELLETSR